MNLNFWREMEAADASGGSFSDKKKLKDGHPTTRTGQWGFSLYGHRLFSLYRSFVHVTLGLIIGYWGTVLSASSCFKYLNTTPASHALGGALKT
ncbi:MAG: hypothetical protein JKY94_13395 [Rhodobacteraceae bacterium]|nr:hypothetical protein [Paracoccaceae bacterium]